MFRKFLRFFLICILLFVLQKPLFMLAHLDLYQQFGADMWWTVVWSGMPLDLAVSAYLTEVLLLVGLLGIWLPRLGKFLEIIWFVITSILIASIFAVDIVLYGYWGFRLDSTALFYFLSSPKDALASVSLLTAIAGAIGVLALSALIFALFYRRCLFIFADSVRSGRLGRSLFALACMALLFVPVRGGFGVSTLNTGRVYFSDQMVLNHAAVNPAFNLVESLSHQSGFSNQYRFMKGEKVQELVAGLRDVEEGESRQILNQKRPNVIFVVLESFFYNLMKEAGEEALAVVPCLDSLAGEGVLFNNFYANSFRTDRGLVSIFSGFPAQPSTSIMKYPQKTQLLPSIPKTLKTEGYDLKYFYGGDLNFTNMRSYLAAMGFEDIVGEKDFPLSQRMSKWGVHDHLVFDYASASISNLCNREEGLSSPICAIVQTSSSHEPFDVPYKHYEDIRLNAIAYTDSCVGAFVRDLRSLPIWDNTLVVLLADHAMQYPLDQDNLVPERYHIPMIWSGGAVQGPIVVDVLGSQIDLSATLLSQLGLDHSEFFYSKDMLDTYSPRFAWYAFPNAFGWIKPNGWLSYDCASNKLIQSSLTPEDLEQGQAFLQSVFDRL